MSRWYPGQQQVDLAVEIEVPGSWFGAGPMGSLTATEQRKKYKAQAVEFAEVHEFPGATKGARKTREKAIRFSCITDATAEPNSEGYWMKLSCTTTTSTTDFARRSRKLSMLTRNSMVKSRVSRTLSRTSPSLLQRRRWRRMEMRIKREETRRSITVLFVTLNKKTHTVSALDCTVH